MKMNSKQVRRYYQRLFNQNERNTANAVRKAIRKDLKGVNPQSIEGIRLIGTDNLRMALLDRFEKNGKRYGNTFFNSFTEKKFNPVFSKAWALYIIEVYGKQLDRKINTVKSTIVDEVIREVKKTIEEGKDVVTTTAAIDKVVNSKQFYKWQSERIARTEVSIAMNSATNVAADATGLQFVKQWLSAGDGNERESHKALNGTKVDKVELFSNGLRYAGDPLGPASEIVNCRCTTLYIPKE